MSKTNGSSAYNIQVLDRVFQILDVLGGSGPELGVTELATKLNLHRSTAHRLVMVLESRRFLERDTVSGKCHLGSRVMQLGLVALARLDMIKVARPYLHRLVDEVKETAHIGLLCDAEVISIANVQSRHTLRSPGTVGTRSPFHCSSQGKAILAFSQREEVRALLGRRILKSHTTNTITSRTRLLEELQMIRRLGYAIDNEEYEVGLRCFAAPVRDSSGEVVAALSIAGPAFRMGDDRIPALSSAVMQTAADVSTSLGYRGNEEGARRYSVDQPPSADSQRSVGVDAV